MAGRPTIYTEKMGAEICERIAEGETLRAIVADDGMPTKSTILAWAVDPKHPFSDQYARARISAATAYADRALDLAERVAMDDGPDANRIRVAIDTLKWAAGRADPKRWGDKVYQEVTQTTHYKVHHEDDVKGAL